MISNKRREWSGLGTGPPCTIGLSSRFSLPDKAPCLRTELFTVTAYLCFPAGFPALDAAPNTETAAAGFVLLLSALGFFFSRLPLDICLSCCTDSMTGVEPYAFHNVSGSIRDHFCCIY